MRGLFAAVAAAALLSVAHGHCPNMCHGHGDCIGINKCDCWSRWTGGDCSMRKCPTGLSWSDQAIADESAHQLAECSDRGLCDTSTGICKCMDGFEGKACDRLTCANDCNGHGTCRSMKYHAANNDRSYSAHPNHALYTYTSNWDADKIWGCECDEGYEGYDCSLRKCPTGDDPLTTPQLNEIQVMKCIMDPSGGGTFTLTYRGFTTATINANDDVGTFTGKLLALPTIRGLNLDFRGAPATVCSNGAVNPITIEFTKDFGDVGHILSIDSNGNHPTTDLFFEYDGGVIDSVASVTCTKEADYCSNRGYCDQNLGYCQCYTGYETSDGQGASGDRGDCGYASTPITECPGTTSCSGHGVCSGHPTYRCTCDVGWMGGDCSERTCLTGKAWYDFPTSENDKAHADAECSNMGICDRTTGECKCHKGFEGSACERITCPGGEPECSSHGKCLNMKQLAEYATLNGDATDYSYGFTPNDKTKWDYNKMYGCYCDEWYQGYDCSERTCPKGDDITTNGDYEMQVIECTTASSGSLALMFRQYTTSTLASTATATDLETALEALDSISDVDVVYSTGATLCTDGVSPNYIQITFKTELGDVPAITETLADAALTVVTYNDGENALAGPNPIVAVQGTKENAECSDRGICDHTTGQCECFVGFGSSDHMGGRGGYGDCGFRLPLIPTEQLTVQGTANTNNAAKTQQTGAFQVIGP